MRVFSLRRRQGQSSEASAENGSRDATPFAVRLPGGHGPSTNGDAVAWTPAYSLESWH